MTPTIDYEGIIKNEEKRFGELKKIQPFEDEQAAKIFKDLSKCYPEAEWYGRCIRFPSLKVIIHPPYTKNSVEGDVAAVRQIAEKLLN